MKSSPAGIALIKEFEGTRLKAYPDPGTGGDPWTIGVGHTGPEVVKGMVITQAQADAYLASDLTRFEAAVTKAVTVSLNQNEFDALVSFAYNCGPANLTKSTLLRKLNAGDRAGAAEQFLVWNRAAGKVLAGLTRRRAAERALFLTPTPAAAPQAPQPPTEAPKPEASGVLANFARLLLAALTRKA